MIVRISAARRETGCWERVAADPQDLQMKPRQRTAASAALVFGCRNILCPDPEWGGCRNSSRPLDDSFGPLVGELHNPAGVESWGSEGGLCWV